MEYFDDLLNPTDMPSVKEAGCRDAGDNLPMTWGKVVEADWDQNWDSQVLELKRK